jgi:protein-S-isoprenylcysteine O-methyltransferase Ste14
VSDNLTVLIIADLIMTFGMVFSISALFVLGKNISIVPQARSLVQSGPYRLVRHPLYLSEMVSLLGVVLARFTASAVALFFLLIACQVYRALQEENLLGGTFPEYESYCLRTSRFIPGVF